MPKRPSPSSLPKINVRSHEDFAATAMTHSAAARARAGGGRGTRRISQSSALSSSETRCVHRAEGDEVDVQHNHELSEGVT